MKFGKLFVLVFLTQIFISQNSQARTFKNAYISFEMLDTWKCKLEQTEWVCRSEDPQESREAVIILTAKEKGPTDTYPIYLDHMGKPMTMNLKSGGTQNSTVTIPPRENKINDQIWYDGLHVNSEIPNYYTRYLATIKDQIAILVTFSAHTKYYSKHSTHFMNTIKSLKVIATKDIMSSAGMAGGLRGKDDIIGGSIQGAVPSDLLAGEEGIASGGKKGLLQNEMFLGGLLVLLLILGYIAMKVYKKK